MKLRLRNIFILSVFLVLLSVEASGQDENPPEPVMESKQCCAGPPPPGLPIDFGLSALIAAGVGLGVYHLKNRR